MCWVGDCGWRIQTSIEVVSQMIENSEVLQQVGDGNFSFKAWLEHDCHILWPSLESRKCPFFPQKTWCHILWPSSNSRKCSLLFIFLKTALLRSSQAMQKASDFCTKEERSTTTYRGDAPAWSSSWPWRPGCNWRFDICGFFPQQRTSSYTWNCINKEA